MNTKLKLQELRGYAVLPKWLKEKYIEAVSGNCQICGKNEEEKLTIHRIKRGNSGGLYTLYPLNHKLNNVLVLCEDCHKLVHGKEFT